MDSFAIILILSYLVVGLGFIRHAAGLAFAQDNTTGFARHLGFAVAFVAFMTIWPSLVLFSVGRWLAQFCDSVNGDKDE